MLTLSRRVAIALLCSLLATVLCSPAFGAAADQTVTYTKDIAPILFANCTSCHRLGDIGPMSLLTYQEVRPWVKSIQRAVVVERVMPPWHSIEPAGTFANDRRLSEEEIQTIAQWASSGAPEGAAGDMPSTPVYTDSWRLGEPDLVLECDPVEVAGDGPDSFHNLIRTADFGGEDKWVEAIEILPGDRRVLHHVIMLSLETLQNSTGNGVQGWLAGWAAGTDPMRMPSGTARLIKDGTQIVANMHYHPSGEAATDVTRVGFHFSDRKDLREVRNHWVMNSSFEIPAGDPNHEATASYTFEKDTDIYVVAPHMHYRGKDMKMWLELPDGSTRHLIDVPGYDFNWQTFYEFPEPVRAPAGTTIQVLGHWNNSAENPANPDPTKTVVFGPQSYDEMFIGILDIADAPTAGGL